ncbi:alpha/beta fold hydrolase [Desulfobacterales bacterium HSG16]|nr:alpha/beta fold hydrolase [Desulfobacterales bacterium HSG16]
MKIKLFLLPFSGGGFHSYNDFLQYTPSWLELIRVDLPGHGKRLCEPLLSDIHKITDDLVSQIRQDICHPYAIYGHSFGATLGYLLCRKIGSENLPDPVHLFVSGRIAPACIDAQVLHKLPGAAFLKGVLSYGGIPEQVLKEPELINMFLPILRADFKAIENYAYEQEDSPLGIPVTAMSGAKDHKVAFEDVMKWQDITSHPLSARKFDGGHFFIFEQTERVMKLIVGSLQNYRFSDSFDPVYQRMDMMTNWQKTS